MRHQEVWLGTSERPTGELLIHFYLPSGSHEINAFLLNKCEAEVLALIREVGRQLDVSFDVEVQGYGEGGFTVLLRLVKSNVGVLTLVGGVIIGVCTAIDWYLYKAPLAQIQIEKGKFELDRDKRLAEQQYEQNELNLKKTRAELKKLEQEVSEAAPKAPATAASQHLPLEPRPKAEDVIPALAAQRKIVRHRSKFYELLLEDGRVSQVGFAQSHRPHFGQEVIVTRDSFVRYIAGPADLEPMLLHVEPVEIISPVLRGSGKWRGILGRKTISFEIQDADFLAKVALSRVKFQAGTTLVCDMQLQPVEDETGEITSYTYTAVRIHKYFNKARSKLTRKGKPAETISEPEQQGDDDPQLDLEIH